MGAHTFSLKIDAKSDKQFKTEFHAAAEEDRHENGRVCSSLAKFKVTGKVTRVRPTGKISHYQVWGWAAD